MCDPGAIQWIAVVFDDCIITTRDKWSFAIGLLSSIVFLVSNIPQIVLNCRAKKVDGQSPFFFSMLFFASTLNLIGVFITHGLITQIIQGIFYCVMDGILFIQFIIYKYIMKTNESNNSQDDIGDTTSKEKESEDVYKDSSEGDSSPGVVEEIPKANAVLATAAFVGEVSASSSTNWKAPYIKDQLVGTLFGWVASAIYICSRIPQITKNAHEQNVGDLSPFYFTLSIAGNFTYCLSVFLRSIESNYIWKQTPFLFGGLGPLACDIIVLGQMFYYNKILKALQEKQNLKRDNHNDNHDHQEHISSEEEKDDHCSNEL